MESNRNQHNNFVQMLHVEWAKFRSGRGLVIGMVIAILVTILPGLIIATFTSCQGPSGNACPSVPVGPGGQAVEDRFYFVHQQLTGDGSITVRLKSMTGIITYPPPNHDQIVSGLVPWAKAGVIIKENIEQGSAYAAVMLTGSHGVRMQYDFTEDIAGLPDNSSAESPRWLRLARSGNMLSGYESSDGIQWSEVGTTRLAGLPSTVRIGLFVTSPCDLTISEGACRFTQVNADFDQVTLQGNVSGTWSSDEIGATSRITDWERNHPNGLVESGGTFTVTGTGDIAPLGAEGGWTIERILIGTVAGLVAVIVIAVLFATVDYQQGLSRTTQLVSHQQDQILIAKAIVIGMITFVAGLITAIAAVVLGRQIVLLNGNSILPVSPLTELRVMFGTAAFLAIVAIFALALGAVFRSRVAAVTAGIALIVIPNIITFANLLPPDVSQWLLRLTPAAGFAVQQSIPEYPQVIGMYVPLLGYYPLAPWVGFAVLCGYAALALSLAIFQLRRRNA